MIGWEHALSSRRRARASGVLAGAVLLAVVFSSYPPSSAQLLGRGLWAAAFLALAENLYATTGPRGWLSGR
ncbi:MAG: hypothetical protein ABEJ31_06200 [Haloarculaceae archaeon]